METDVEAGEGVERDRPLESSFKEWKLGSLRGHRPRERPLESSFKEWKLSSTRGRPCINAFLLNLPLRNGNEAALLAYAVQILLLNLPLRNGNPPV